MIKNYRHHKTKKLNQNKKKQLPKYITITNKNNTKNTKDKNNNSNSNYITSEVLDDATYTHFKSLVDKSPNLCKGQTQSGKKYKIRKSLLLLGTASR